MEANYPSDLSDEQWQAISRLIPPAKPGGRPRTVNMRNVLDGLFYLARTGCAWRMLPIQYPPSTPSISISRPFAGTGRGNEFLICSANVCV